MQTAMEQAITEDGTLDLSTMPLPRKEVLLYEGPDLVLATSWTSLWSEIQTMTSTSPASIVSTAPRVSGPTNIPDELGGMCPTRVEELVNEVRQRENSDNFMRQSDIATGMLIDETPAVELLEMWGNFHVKGQNGETQSLKNFRAVVETAVC